MYRRYREKQFQHQLFSIRGTRDNRKATTIGNTKGETTMKYVIDMRTLTVVSLELDDTNVHDKEVLMNMETTTGRILPVAIKETLLNEEVDY